MNQAMKNAISNHAGMPHKSTLRKPGLYTASANVTAANAQNMKVSFPGHSTRVHGGIQGGLNRLHRDQVKS